MSAYYLVDVRCLEALHLGKVEKRLGGRTTGARITAAFIRTLPWGATKSGQRAASWLDGRDSVRVVSDFYSGEDETEWGAPLADAKDWTVWDVAPNPSTPGWREWVSPDERQNEAALKARASQNTPPPYSFGSDVLPGLSKLVEEAGEALQVCGKILAKGGAVQHWDGTDLAVRFQEELADLQAAIKFVIEANGLNEQKIGVRRAKKLRMYWKWRDIEQEEGPP